MVAIVLLSACVGSTDAQAPTQPGNTPVDVRVEVNAAAAHQVMEGFGATTVPLIYASGADDKLPPAIRTRALEAAYRDVKLTLGNVEFGAWEPNNDDGDPMFLNEAAFDFTGLKTIADRYVVPARALGADGLFPGNMINMIATPWMQALRTSDYNRYVDEAAEYVVSGVLKWRDATGDIPRYHALFSEALFGNKVLRGGSSKEIIDIIKRAGARLRAVGMPTKFLVVSEESVGESITLAREILSDPVARQYVGVIGYHPYPYGSAYVSMPRILAGPGQGNREDGAIAERRAIRELGREYNIPIWMTEVSAGELDPRSMDALRARAIAIHDELGFADASAYFGMLAVWDSQSHLEHFGPGNSLYQQQDMIVLIDLPTSNVLITGTGYAIGHYARWVERGALRVEASSDDPLVMVTAFTHNRTGKASFVIVNNADGPKTVRVHATGLAFTGALSGEQSYGTVRWGPLGAITPDGDAKDAFVVTVPGKSVTSVGGSF